MNVFKYLLLSLIFLITTGLFAQSYNFKAKQAEIKWTGKKLGGTHYGYIKLKEGSLMMENSQITAATFVIDMKSIKNVDVENKEDNKKLIGHLSSDDFFGVEKYPEAMLKITESTAFENHKAILKGDLTIKGITHPIAFTATYSDHKLMTSITVDRSKYNIKYASKSFFKNLGDEFIYDNFTLDVSLVLENE